MIGNTPNATHDLSFERAKSYAFNIKFKARTQPYDLDGCSLRLVAKAPRHKGGSVVITLTAEIIDATEGEARFYFQASDLDLDPTDYAYDVTLIDPNDYSIPILKGSIILGDNVDGDDTNTYDTVTPSSGFLVYMESGSTVSVQLYNVAEDVVTSINGFTGTVSLGAEDVHANPGGHVVATYESVQGQLDQLDAAVALGGGGPGPGPGGATPSLDAARVRDLADWIVTCVVNRAGNPQSLNGAIGQYTPGTTVTHIKWYQANLAARFLSRAAAYLGDASYASVAQIHLLRYQAQMDPTTGYVTDKFWNGTAWVPDGNGSGGANGSGNYYDSTDSYAATFLMALESWTLYSGDLADLNTSFGAGIAKAYTAIGGTWNSTVHLTTTVPSVSYQAALLEDVAEVYGGLLSGTRMSYAIGSTSQAGNFATRASQIRTSINEKMYQSGAGWYAAPGRNMAGGYATNVANSSPPNDVVSDLASLASRAMPQAWAVRYGIADKYVATELMDKVHAAQPNWWAAGTNYDAAPITMAYLMAGQEARGYFQAVALYHRAEAAGFAWPFTPMGAGAIGETLIAASTGVFRDAWGAVPAGGGGGGGGPVDAEDVTYDPGTGTYAVGSDVQTAIEQLDVQAVAATVAHNAHLADTVDAHDASAVSVVNSSWTMLFGSHVQQALGEVDAILANLAATRAFKSVTITAGGGLSGGGTLNANMAIALTPIANGRIMGNVSGSNAVPTELLPGQVKALLAVTPADITGFDTGVRTSRLDQMAAPTAAVSLNSQKITNLATPTVGTDAATKAYADSVAAGGGVPATLVDAKGDILTATADNTTARLGVGANLTMLIADSSQATGLRWGTPAGANISFNPSGLTNLFGTNVQQAIGEIDAILPYLVPISRSVIAGTGLTGGGTLNADRTLSISAGGVGTTELAADGVTFAKTQNIATARVLGRVTASTGDIEELTAAQIKTLLALKQTDLRRIVSLTDGATIAINADITDLGSVTIAGNRTMGNPSGTPVNGQTLQFRIRQDATGSRTMAWSADYRFGTDITATALTATANKTDYVGFQYNSIDGKWDCISFVKGF